MNNSKLRILTYNIHKGFNVGNRRFVLHHIREALIEINADLLCLQEIQGIHKKHQKNLAEWPKDSQAEFLADGGWAYYAYGKNAVYRNGHHGNAILSKHPLASWENINVSPYSWASRSLLHGIIHLGEKQTAVHVVCVHFGLSESERKLQTQTLCKRIESHIPHDAPLIIAGDFNDWRGIISRYFHEHLQLQEVFQSTQGHHARTFPAWLPVLPMDRIYYRGLNLINCEQLKHLRWRSLSDHAPLTASFQL
ncbi:MAG: EEP domain-containing protein [Methylococcaceae bacterium]|nr:EEP domain-containing protein [Methylococcaceae bacterium]